jgi:hypothetical protein
VSFAWRCRSPSGRAWQPREFSRPFAGCLCPRRRASEAMLDPCSPRLGSTVWCAYGSRWGASQQQRPSRFRITRRRSTTNRPSHLQAPSAFCSLAWRGLRLGDDETAGAVPWCDCASGQRLFRLSLRRLHRRDDATALRAASYDYSAAVRAVVPVDAALPWTAQHSTVAV